MAPTIIELVRTCSDQFTLADQAAASIVFNLIMCEDRHDEVGATDGAAVSGTRVRSAFQVRDKGAKYEIFAGEFKALLKSLQFSPYSIGALVSAAMRGHPQCFGREMANGGVVMTEYGLSLIYNSLRSYIEWNSTKFLEAFEVKGWTAELLIDQKVPVKEIARFHVNKSDIEGLF